MPPPTRLIVTAAHPYAYAGDSIAAKLILERLDPAPPDDAPLVVKCGEMHVTYRGEPKELIGRAFDLILPSPPEATDP